MPERSPIRRRFATLASSAATVLFALGLAMSSVSCSSLAPRAFEHETPAFNPQAFFAGHTHSWGVFENRAGNPVRRFTTDCHGKWEGAILVLDQRFTYDDGKTQQRHWRIWRLDAHRYAATANDVAGVAMGEAHGNAFHWAYTVELKPGNPLFNVHLEQWMYLQIDGTMLNRGSIKKLGLLLAQVTEHFRRDKNSPTLRPD